LDRAFEAGVDFFDTANVYPLGGGLETIGRTEEIIGRWLEARGVRDRVLLATKCFGPFGEGKNDRGLSRQAIMRAVEGSLRRLKTDVLDIYQSHGADPHTPIEETLRAFDDLVRTGKVRYIGSSNYPAFRLALALGASARGGLVRYESTQSRYNMLYREIETELVPLALDQGLSLLVYNPIAGGMLSGKHKPGGPPVEGSRFTLGQAGVMYQYRYFQEPMLAFAQRFAEACRTRDLHPVTAAVAWTLSRPAVSSVIIGASRPDQLDASLRAPEVTLDAELLALCDEAFFSFPRRPVLDGYR